MDLSIRTALEIAFMAILFGGFGVWFGAYYDATPVRTRENQHHMLGLPVGQDSRFASRKRNSRTA